MVLKIKIRFNRRYSTFITLLACAFSLSMMVRTFGFPVEELTKIGVISLISLVSIVLIAAPLALLLRYIANKHEQE